MEPDNSAVEERGDSDAKGLNRWAPIITAVAGMLGAVAALVSALRG